MTKRAADIAVAAPPSKPAAASLPHAAATAQLDVAALRRQFPILAKPVHGKPLVYLDNAATTQKPQSVIDAESDYYQSHNANIHRGVYSLSQDATALHERARTTVRRFIHAAEDREIIFTRSATESINLVAASFGSQVLRKGDQILITGMEHHSNIVPWQLIAQRTGAILRAVPFSDSGQLDLDQYEKLLTDNTRIVALVHLSNSLGTINPVKSMIELAHRQGATVLIDGAQWIAHGPTDVRDLDADFYAFSGHKMYGPTGIGVLYGKAKLLDAMPPYQGGGDMISSVTIEETTYNDLPYKFEAGTPNIAGAIGLAAAIDFINSIGLPRLAAHEKQLFDYATSRLAAVPNLRIIGTAPGRAAVISFLLGDIHPHDIGTILDGQGIAVRTGHHCCQPVMDRLGISATARASLGAYNTKDDIDALVAGLDSVIRMFAA
jgi:cysteine desulfurase/selenocysteine lyase